MTPELEAEIRDFFHWFCGVDQGNGMRLMEDRGDITYREVAERINDKLREPQGGSQ